MTCRDSMLASCHCKAIYQTHSLINGHIHLRSGIMIVVISPSERSEMGILGMKENSCHCDCNRYFIATDRMLKKIAGNYRQVSNIRRTLVGYKIVDHSDVVGASPVGAAPTTSSFST